MDELTKRDIAEIAAQKGAEAGVKAFRKEKEKFHIEKVDRRLRNTKMLLQHFREFKAHTENAVYDVEQLDESAYEIIDLMNVGASESELYVDSIRKSVARTVTIVQHIDTMLGLYETWCGSCGNPEEERRCRVIKALYVNEQKMTITELAKCERVTERTIYRDVDDAVERIATLVFGIDGIKKK